MQVRLLTLYCKNSSYYITVVDTVQIFALVRLNRLIQFYRLPMAFSYLESRVEKETGVVR